MIDFPSSDPMVSADWLIAHIGDTDLRVFDATWSLPGQSAPHDGQYIDGPHFDIDAIADPDAPLKHTLPSPEIFTAAAAALGVNAGSRIVVYDRHGLFSAPRAWWMFRVMGLSNVRVLDGGLPTWLARGGKVRKQPKNYAKTYGIGNFSAQFMPALFAGRVDVQNALHGKSQIFDARAAGRFTGEAPEPRAELSSGHMPGARSAPFGSLKTNGGFLRAKDELANIFKTAGLKPDTNIITSCGSGVTACGIALALARLGLWNVAVYDGSWVDWASSEDCPIISGPVEDLS